MVKISKTYIPNLKEKYMCEKHKTYFKKKLTEWKSEIIKSNNEALYNNSLDDNPVIMYLNRLSDYFFVLSRYHNKQNNIPENTWQR